jgi:putative redox protein
VLAAAHRIPSAVAVATIASPAGTEHLRSTLLRQAPHLPDAGEADVEIAGRPFRVRARLLEDLREHNVRSRVERLGRALMIFHSPADRVVSIEQAGQLFRAAAHPKSFVSVDGADHLLLRDVRDADYIGQTLAAWASRYVEMEK